MDHTLPGFSLKAPRPALVILAALISAVSPPLLAQTAMPAGQTTASPTPSSPVQTERFAIERFALSGNRLFSTAELSALVAHLIGPDREYGDIQRAVETLELAYRQRGYAAVQVYVPEQELTGGSVRLNILESTIGQVSIEGESRHFDTDNVRAALPALRENTTPNARDLSAQVALANENPARQLEVVLGIGAREDTVDARIRLTEQNPLKLNLSLDNTGSHASGRHRLGVALQHANLWNRDHVATLAYQTSPEKPDQVDIYSFSYRLPVYAWAGAFDLIVAKSTVNAGTTPTTAGDLSFAGSGDVFGLRYTHALPRQGDMSHKLILGWDVKATDNTCSLGTFGSTGCGASAVDVTLRPLSLTYQRTQLAPGSMTDWTASLAVNLPGGAYGSDKDFAAARPSPTVPGKGAQADYHVLRGTFTHLRLLPQDWQLRAHLQAQWTDQPLLTQEQLGLAGNTAVRGFLEREVARDTGAVLNLEGYTPNVAEAVGLPGSLRALAFVDAAYGHNQLLSGELQPKNSLSSWGLGLRYLHGKHLSARFDLAQVLTANGAQGKGDWRGHLGVSLSY